MLGTHRLSPTLYVDRWFNSVVFYAVFLFVVVPLVALGQAIYRTWRRWFPPPPRPPAAPLPVNGNDPVWGRSVNRTVAEAAFRAVQEARSKGDPALAECVVGRSLGRDLKRERDDLLGRGEVNPRCDVRIDDVRVYDERIDRREFNGRLDTVCSFRATVRGTMTSYVAAGADGRVVSGSPAPQPFEEEMEFVRPDRRSGRWLLAATSGLAHRKKPKRAKKPRDKAEPADAPAPPPS